MSRGRLVIVLVVGHFLFFAGCVATGDVPVRPIVEGPVFDPAPGLALTARAIAITTPTPGASVRYTTDGSTPSPTDGTLYTGPVTVLASTTLKAVAYRDGWAPSDVAAGDFERVGIASADHTVAVRSDGTVWSWGHNYRGQLGDGTAGDGPRRPGSRGSPVSPRSPSERTSRSP